jgi:uncharacterized protein YndB with AHSA1/START domain
MTEVYRTEMDIDASPDDVFRYFVDEALLATWLGISARLRPEPGGVFSFEVAPGEWCRGEYRLVDPPRRVVFTWGWETARIDVPPGSTTVEVELAPRPGGTRLVLVHRGLSGDLLGLHAQGWAAYLDRLLRALAGEDPGPDPAVTSPEEALDRLRGRS